MGNLKERILAIDWLRGVGIILVVLGHSLSYNTPTGINENYYLRNLIYNFIYSFHMPLMFVVSGIVFSRKIITSQSTDFKLSVIKSRFQKLMIPYFVYAVFYLPLKIIFASLARKQIEASDIWRVFIGENPNTALWFLYALFVFSCFTILFLKKENIKYFLLISLPLTFLGGLRLTGILILDKCFYNLFFFILGIYFGMHYNRLLIEDSKKIEKLLCSLFAFVVGLYLYNLGYAVVGPITGLLGSYILLIIAVLLEKKDMITSENMISKVGSSTMGIYLFHNPIQVIIRTIFTKVFLVPYALIVFFKFIFGFGGSLFIQKFLIEKSKILSFLFLGKPYIKR